MSRFSEEVSLIPKVAWGIAVALYAGFAAILALILAHERSAPEVVKLLLPVLAPLPLAIFVLLIGYVNIDSRRRGMRHVMWTLLAIFVPNGIGIILYFVLREPLLRPCPRCQGLTRPGFAFCPRCGEALSNACPQCRKAIETGWSHCPYCGAKL